jgi:glycosyltransferase involved in cell wall biosynthesis
MKIAHIIPYSVSFPLKLPNGRYNWVLQLATLQASKGHDVTIYGHPDSQVKGVKTIGLTRAGDSKYKNNQATFRLALSSQHDVYHSHFDSLHYELAHETSKPIVFTQHWWPSETVVSLAATSPGNVWAVPPTQYMYEFDSQHGIKTNSWIYHGIDLSLFKPEPAAKNGRLLFVGRISPEKNLDLAISVSIKSGLGLDIIGKVTEINAKYWEKLQSSVDGTHVRYLGVKTQDELLSYYTSASALIFPSDVNEPFGLVALEAQACGTPVIMKRGGSRGEVVRDGVTGFLCETEEDFVRAAKASGSLDSSDCLSFAADFSIEKMEAAYTKLYNDLTS